MEVMEKSFNYLNRMVRIALVLFAGFVVACGDDKTEDPGDRDVPVEEITLSETSLVLALGDVQELTATVKPENATDKRIVWSSDKPEVVTVDDKGEITAVGAGSGTVTAAIGEVKATCAVTIAPEVYIVGSYSDNTAVMWANDVQTDLTDGGIAALANDVYVSTKGDVYIVGWDTPDTGNGRAVLWKNGEISYLSDGSNIVQAKSVFVHGDDVYVAGNEVGTKNKVFLWKNGTATVLPSTANYAEVGSMLVTDNGDVYVAGYDNGPVVWKNGVKTGENFGDAGTQLLGIGMRGTEFYYSGYRSDDEGMYRAMVWKGTPPQATELTDGAKDSYGNAVWVSQRGDVYVAGNQSSSPKIALLWKNGTLQTLSDDSYKAFDVSGFGDDLYVVGQISTGSFPFGTQKAALWKNGETQTLCEEKSDARAVFVRVK